MASLSQLNSIFKIFILIINYLHEIEQPFCHTQINLHVYLQKQFFMIIIYYCHFFLETSPILVILHLIFILIILFYRCLQEIVTTMWPHLLRGQRGSP